MSNQLVIARLANHCRLFGAQTDAHLIKNEFKRILISNLPHILATEFERQFTSLSPAEGLYRIRKLHLKLTLQRSDLLLTDRLADLLATHLVTELSQQLNSHSGNVVYFKNEADFVAALISDLLLGSAWDNWVYEEFSFLHHLDAIEAVVQLLLPRKAIIKDIVQGLLQRQQLSHLTNTLHAEQAMQLYRLWTGHSPTVLFKQTHLPPLSKLENHLAVLQTVSIKSTSATEPLVLLTLRSFLATLAQKQMIEPDVALWVLAHYCFLNRYGALLLPLLKQPSVDRTLPQSLLQAEDNVRQLAADLLQWADEKLERRVYLDKVFQATDNAVAMNPPVVSRSSVHNAIPVFSQNDCSQMIYSECAGLVLLIPVLVSIGLYPQFQAATLRTALTLALNDDPGQLQPGWLNTLLPDTSDKTDTEGNLPTTWHLGLSQQKQNEISALAGSKQLASLLLAHFAARLSGLQESSASYIRSQFFHHSGTIKVDEAEIVVQLDAIPLYIVLRMSGLAGWQDTLPWLKRKLIIEVSQ